MKRALLVITFALCAATALAYPFIGPITGLKATFGGDPTPPELAYSAYITADGDTTYIAFTRDAQQGVNYADSQWDLQDDASGVNLTCDDTDPNLWVCANASTVAAESTTTLAYTQHVSGNGVEADDTGTDMVDFTAQSVNVDAITGTEPPTYQDEFYCTQTGTSDGDSDTIDISAADFNNENSWSSNISADEDIGPGDVVYFSGTFTSALIAKGSGVSTHWIVLDGYQTNDTVDVVGGDSTSGFALLSGTSKPLTLSGQSYLRVRDFRVTDWAGDWGIGGNPCTNIEVLNNYLYDASSLGRRGVAFLSTTTFNDSFLVEGNKISGILDNGSVGSVGFAIGGSKISDWIIRGNDVSECIDSVAWHSGVGVLVEYNYFHDMPETNDAENHVDSKQNSSNIIVRFNKFIDDRTKTDTYGTEAAVIFQRGTDNAFAYGNYFYGSRIAINFYGGSTEGAWGEADKLAAWSNLIVNTEVPFNVYNTTAGTIGNVAIVGNTIHTASGSTNANRGGIYAWAGTELLIYNNVIENCKNNSNYRAIACKSGSNRVSYNNLAYHSDATAKAYWEESETDFEDHENDNERADPNLTDYEPTVSSTNVVDQGVAVPDTYDVLPDFADLITIDGETYCNNNGGTCDELLSFDVGLLPSTDWSVFPTASSVDEGLQSDQTPPEIGVYIYVP